MVLLGGLGSVMELDLKASLTLIFVFSFLVPNLVQLPFGKGTSESEKVSKVLHKMESMSLVVAFVTFWGGLLFLRDASSKRADAEATAAISCNSSTVEAESGEQGSNL